jgi:hypothetical protein
VIDSSDEEGGIKSKDKGKGKGKATEDGSKKRMRYDLTPPPEMTEEKRAQIHQAVE